MLFCLRVFHKGKNSKYFQVEEEETIKNLMQLTSPISGHQMLPGHSGHYLTSRLMSDSPWQGVQLHVWGVPLTSWNEGCLVGCSNSGPSQPGRTVCLLELIIPCEERGKKHDPTARKLHWEVHTGAHSTSAPSRTVLGPCEQGSHGVHKGSTVIHGASGFLQLTYKPALWP